ncbi:OprO/OprP family phosphate-selective porin [Phenylobacterium sp.]|uniref:OprO/OprP family phosphate-selective porin n=1 Tax=Phenylobacterium sp. TaxID=1871053 RepID=UPI002DEE5399|nr:porin [Phenylobacterium sp.]
MMRALLMGASLGVLASAAQAAPNPDPRDEEIAILKAQVKALNDRVENLEAHEATPRPVVVAAAPTLPPPPPAAAPVVQTSNWSGGATILAGKPSIQSADGRFSATLHGVMQFDVAQYLQADPGPVTADFRRGAAAADTAHARDLSSGSNFRRARIGFDGKVYGDIEYQVLFEFGGAGEEDAGHVQELWLQYSGLKPFHLRIGAYPPSIGLEDQGPTNGQPFVERPAEADMTRSLAGGDFREAGEVWAAGERWYANAAITGRLVGVVNSQATGVSQPFDSQLGYIGRLVYLPVLTDDALVHVGVHGAYVARPADAGGPDVVAGRYPITIQERPELRVDGTRLVSTGAIDARHASVAGLEFAAQYANLWVEGEYDRFTIERRLAPVGVSNPRFTGFYVEASWILTGEKRRYNTGNFSFDGPPVDHPLSLTDGTWGALELAARYSDIDLNYHPGAPGTAPPADAVRGGDQRIVTLGANWYLNPVVRFMLEVQDVRVDRLSPSATTFQTPVGAQVGQHYHAVALRSQMAF